mgnify:CR=1 FL=1
MKVYVQKLFIDELGGHRHNGDSEFTFGGVWIRMDTIYIELSRDEIEQITFALKDRLKLLLGTYNTTIKTKEGTDIFQKAILGTKSAQREIIKAREILME